MTPTGPHTKSSKSAKARAAANQATIPPSATTSASRETIPPSQEDSVPNPGICGAPLGREFGRYEIRECLGQGAMGAVYKARDLQLDRIVALKIPKLSEPSEPELLERFYREARAAATLNHPNLCPVYDVGDYEGTHYISMGYIDGRPLSDFIKPGKPLPERKAAGVIRKLSLALTEAHRQGIVHRDLKPDNVMIDRRGQPIVMDFGLAQQSKTEGDIRATQSGQMLGTPAYMSPEQVDGDLDRIGPASDVYSLGVILYELLTGELPYQGSVASVLAQIIQGEPELPSQKKSGLDPNLEAVCLKMMAADADRRYPSMAEVTKALTEWMKGESAASVKTLQNPTSPEPESDEGLAALFHAVDVETKPVHETLSPQSRRTIRPQAGKQTSPQHQEQPLWQKPGVRWVAGGLAAGLLLLGILLFVRVGDETVKIEIDDPNAQVFVDGDNVAIKNLGATVELRPGEHNLEVRRGDVVVQTDRFEVVQGKNRVLKVSVVEPRQKGSVTVDIDPPAQRPLSAQSPKSPNESKPTEAEQPRKVAGDPKTLSLHQSKQDVHRQVAKWAVGLQGQVSLNVSGARSTQWVRKSESIPDNPYEVRNIQLPAGKTVTLNDLKAISQLKTLLGLNAKSCGIGDEGVRLIAQNRGLIDLHLDGNPITDSGLRYLTGLESLQVLWLKNCPVTDAGLRHLADLPSLRTLILENTKVTDDSTDSLAQLSELEDLDLAGTEITDAAVRRLNALPNLQSLYLSGTKITDQSLKTLAGHETLTVLQLTNTKVTDAGLAYLPRIPQLRSLILNGCDVTDEGLASHVTKLKELRILGLEDTKLSDQGLDALRRLPEITNLRIHNTQVTPASVARFRAAHPRIYIFGDPKPQTKPN